MEEKANKRYLFLKTSEGLLSPRLHSILDVFLDKIEQSPRDATGLGIQQTLCHVFSLVYIFNWQKLRHQGSWLEAKLIFYSKGILSLIKKKRNYRI